MAKFKVGDRVKKIGGIYHVGGVGTVISIDSDGDVYIDFGQGNIRWADAEDCELISNNNKIMDIKEKFLVALKSEPHKSFRKAGITNGDDLLTEEGQSIFLTYLLNKYGSEFKKDIVDGLLEDSK